MVKDFFKDFEGKRIFERTNQLMLFFLGVVLLFITTNFPDQAFIVLTYLFMLVVWGFISVIETTGSKKTLKLLRVYGIGKLRNFGISLVSGLIIGAILVFGLPFATAQPIFSTVQLGDFSFIYIVVFAPLVEAVFFRGLLFGAVSELLNQFNKMPNLNGFIALVLQAIVFAFFHFAVAGFDVTALLPHFFFGILAGIGVILFRSIGFEYGLHFANNYLVFTGGL